MSDPETVVAQLEEVKRIVETYNYEPVAFRLSPEAFDKLQDEMDVPKCCTVNKCLGVSVDQDKMEEWIGVDIRKKPGRTYTHATVEAFLRDRFNATLQENQPAP